MLLTGTSNMPPLRPTLIDSPGLVAVVGTSDVIGPSTERASSMESKVVDWKSRLSANVRSLSQLRAGWDGPGSVPVPETLLARAAFYVQSALDAFEGMTAPRLVPGGDGSVQIEWHSVRGELEFDIDDQGFASIWGRDHLSGMEFDGEGREALALFYRWAPLVASRYHNAADVPAQTQMATFLVAA